MKEDPDLKFEGFELNAKFKFKYLEVESDLAYANRSILAFAEFEMSSFLFWFFFGSDKFRKLPSISVASFGVRSVLSVSYLFMISNNPRKDKSVSRIAL